MVIVSHCASLSRVSTSHCQNTSLVEVLCNVESVNCVQLSIYEQQTQSITHYGLNNEQTTHSDYLRSQELERSCVQSRWTHRAAVITVGRVQMYTATSVNQSAEDVVVVVAERSSSVSQLYGKCPGGKGSSKTGSACLRTAAERREVPGRRQQLPCEVHQASTLVTQTTTMDEGLAWWSSTQWSKDCHPSPSEPRQDSPSLGQVLQLAPLECRLTWQPPGISPTQDFPRVPDCQTAEPPRHCLPLPVPGEHVPAADSLAVTPRGQTLGCPSVVCGPAPGVRSESLVGSPGRD